MPRTAPRKKAPARKKAPVGRRERLEGIEALRMSFLERMRALRQRQRSLLTRVMGRLDEEKEARLKKALENA